MGMDREPDIEKQLADANKEYKEGQITKEEYSARVNRIAHWYSEWMHRNR